MPLQIANPVVVGSDRLAQVRELPLLFGGDDFWLTDTRADTRAAWHSSAA